MLCVIENYLCYKYNVYSFYKSIALLHTSPSEFLAELTNNQHSPIYIVICDPLLKLLVIPLHHVIEYENDKILPEYIFATCKKGLVWPVKD